MVEARGPFSLIPDGLNSDSSQSQAISHNLTSYFAPLAQFCIHSNLYPRCICSIFKSTNYPTKQSTLHAHSKKQASTPKTMSFSIAIPHPTHPAAASSSSSSASSSTTKPSQAYPQASSSVSSLDSSNSTYDYAGSPPHARNLLQHHHQHQHQHQHHPFTPHRPSPLAMADAGLLHDVDSTIPSAPLPPTMASSGSNIGGGNSASSSMAAAAAAAAVAVSSEAHHHHQQLKMKKEKGRALSGDYGSSPFAPRRASLMGRELERVEHIVVEVGSPEAPRLVCFSSLSFSLSLSDFFLDFWWSLFFVLSACICLLLET